MIDVTSSYSEKHLTAEDRNLLNKNYSVRIFLYHGFYYFKHTEKDRAYIPERVIGHDLFVKSIQYALRNN